MATNFTFPIEKRDHPGKRRVFEYVDENDNIQVVDYLSENAFRMGVTQLNAEHIAGILGNVPDKKDPSRTDLAEMTELLVIIISFRGQEKAAQMICEELYRVYVKKGKTEAVAKRNAERVVQLMIDNDAWPSNQEIGERVAATASQASAIGKRVPVYRDPIAYDVAVAMGNISGAGAEADIKREKIGSSYRKLSRKLFKAQPLIQLAMREQIAHAGRESEKLVRQQEWWNPLNALNEYIFKHTGGFFGSEISKEIRQIRFATVGQRLKDIGSWLEMEGAGSGLFGPFKAIGNLFNSPAGNIQAIAARQLAGYQAHQQNQQQGLGAQSENHPSLDDDTMSETNQMTVRIDDFERKLETLVSAMENMMSVLEGKVKGPTKAPGMPGQQDQTQLKPAFPPQVFKSETNPMSLSSLAQDDDIADAAQEEDIGVPPPNPNEPKDASDVKISVTPDGIPTRESLRELGENVGWTISKINELDEQEQSNKEGGGLLKALASGRILSALAGLLVPLLGAGLILGSLGAAIHVATDPDSQRTRDDVLRDSVAELDDHAAMRAPPRPDLRPEPTTRMPPALLNDEATAAQERMTARLAELEARTPPDMRINGETARPRERAAPAPTHMSDFRDESKFAPRMKRFEIDSIVGGLDAKFNRSEQFGL